MTCLDCAESKKYYPDGDTSDPLFSLECNITGRDLGYGKEFPVPSTCPLLGGKLNERTSANA